jgi:hypothetical protein
MGNILTATRYYRAMLTNSGCTSYSTAVTVTVTALSVTGITICVGGSGIDSWSLCTVFTSIQELLFSGA